MTAFPELETKRLLLREIKQSDSQDIFHIFSNERFQNGHIYALLKKDYV